MATATGVTTALKAAEEKLKSLSWETKPPSSDVLRSDMYIFFIFIFINMWECEGCRIKSCLSQEY